MYPVSQLLPLPLSIPLDIPPGRMQKITLAYAACQESTSTSTPIACSCKRGCKTARCQCKKYKQQCSVACHEEGIDCGNLSSLATRTEKGQVHHADKCRRANTAGDRIEEEEEEEEEEDSENSLMQKELSRLIASKGNSAPLWTLEPDLVGMTRAGRSFVPRVQSEMRLRNRHLGAQEPDEDEE